MSVIIDKDVDTYALPQNMTLADAASRFIREAPPMIVVVDDEGRFVGILTQGDIVRALHNQSSTEVKLKDICNRNSRTATIASIERDTKSLRADYEAFGVPILQMPVLDEARKFVGLASFCGDEGPAAAINAVAPLGVASISYLKKMWELALYIDNAGVGGDIAECGVWRGTACAVAAAAHLTRGAAARHIHVFDAFHGESLKKPDDARANFSRHKPFAYHAAEDIFSRCVNYPGDLLHFHSPNFSEPIASDTLPENIALLNLGGDWHYTLEKYFVPCLRKMSDGGIVAVDDYSHIAGFMPFVKKTLRAEGFSPLLFNGDGMLFFVVNRGGRAQ